MAYKERKLNGKGDVEALYNALGMPDKEKKPAVKKKPATARKPATGGSPAREAKHTATPSATKGRLRPAP